MRHFLLSTCVVTSAIAAEFAHCSNTIVVRPGDDIQLAIDTANAGDTLQLQPGTYPISDPLVIADKSLVIKGDPALDGSGSPVTVIDANFQTSFLDADGPDSVTIRIEDLLVTGAKVRDDTIIAIDGGVRFEIAGCYFDGCRQTWSWAVGSIFSISDDSSCMIDECHFDGFGTRQIADVHGTDVTRRARLTVKDSVFRHEPSYSSSSRSFGVNAVHADIDMTRVDFIDTPISARNSNNAFRNCNLSLTSCSVVSNGMSSGLNSAILGAEDSTVTIDDLEIRGFRLYSTWPAFIFDSTNAQVSNSSIACDAGSAGASSFETVFAVLGGSDVAIVDCNVTEARDLLRSTIDVVIDGTISYKNTFVCGGPVFSLDAEDLGGNCANRYCGDSTADSVPDCGYVTSAVDIDVPSDYPTIAEAIANVPLGTDDVTIRINAGSIDVADVLHTDFGRLAIIGLDAAAGGTDVRLRAGSSDFINHRGDLELRNLNFQDITDRGNLVRVEDHLVMGRVDIVDCTFSRINSNLDVSSGQLLVSGCTFSDIDLRDEPVIRHNGQTSHEMNDCRFTSVSRTGYSRWRSVPIVTELSADTVFSWYYNSSPLINQRDPMQVEIRRSEFRNLTSNGSDIAIAFDPESIDFKVAVRDCFLVDSGTIGGTEDTLYGSRADVEIRASGSTFCGTSQAGIDLPWIDEGGNCLRVECIDTEAPIGVPDCYVITPVTHDVRPGEDVQAVLDGVSEYDIVRFAPGAYPIVSPFVIPVGNLTFMGTEGAGGAPATIFDGLGVHKVLVVESGSSNLLRFENLHVMNCSGPAFEFDSSSEMSVASAEFVNCVFDGNSSDESRWDVASCIKSTFRWFLNIDSCDFLNSSERALSARGPVEINGSRFIDNKSNRYSGGAVFIYSELVYIADSEFTRNGPGPQSSNYFSGGAIYLEESEGRGGFVMERCIFTDNHASEGGAFYTEDRAPILRSCTFENNTATYGGGALKCTEYCSGTPDPEIVECVIRGNTAESGGGLYVSYGSMLVSGCEFDSNVALQGGGGIYVYSCDEPNFRDGMNIDNTVLFGNHAVTGGAMLIEGGCIGKLSDMTVIQNTADTTGGIHFDSYDLSLSIMESTICENTGGNITGIDLAFMPDVCSLDDSQCCYDRDFDGLENDLDPYPDSPFDNGIEDDDLLWVSPGMSIQGAIDLALSNASDGDSSTPVISVINIEPDTYYGGIDMKSQSLTLRPGTSGLMTTYVTIDAGGTSPCIVNPQSSTFQSLILINGYNPADGGGLVCGQGDSPSLQDVIITNCIADGVGGGIGITGGGSANLTACVIFRNQASDGGALAISSASGATLTECLICDNSPEQITGLWLDFGSSISDTCSPTGGDGEVPDPNPVPNPDGTQTWYVGNNVQYPVIQEVLDAVSAGDEIVIMGGEYVESLMIDIPDVTIRPATSPGAMDANGGFQSVVLWNPTEGPLAENDEALYLGANTSNTVVGRPSEFTQLANGLIVPTLIPISGFGFQQEYSADATLVEICNIAYTDLASMTRMQRGLAGPFSEALAMSIWSRSIDKVAVRSHDGLATVSHVAVSTQNGFGGGLCLTGTNNATSFVGCTITGTRSGGQLNDGSPVHAVYIGDGAPLFTGCTIDQNIGSVDGVILQEGGSGSWIGCSIGGTFGNVSPVSNGTMVIRDGAHPTILDSTFSNNLSRFGTIRFDSTLNGSHQPLLVSNTIFDENETTDGQYGAIAYCTDAVAGRSPLLVMDRVVCSNTGQSAGTQSGVEWYETDVVSNYAPRYRILRDVSSNVINADTQPAGVAANGGGDGSGMVEVSADLNGDGVVNGQDLAIILGAWTP